MNSYPLGIAVGMAMQEDTVWSASNFILVGVLILLLIGIIIYLKYE